MRARNYWQEIDYKTLVSPTEVTDTLYDLSEMRDEAESERWHANLTCFATHATQSDTSSGENRCYVELRPDRSNDRFAALLLAVTSAVVAFALHRHWYATAPVKDFLTIFLAVPGALTAAMTRTASALSKRVTDGLIYLGYIAGASALMMAVTAPLSDKSILFRSLPVVAALAAGALAVVLFWIEGPSRFFDRPTGAMETLEGAKKTIRLEKIWATIYIGASLFAAIAFIAKLRYW